MDQINPIDRLDANMVYDYTFNPDEDELLMTGMELEPGMAVLVEDWWLRVDARNVLPGTVMYEKARRRNRWCIVGRVDTDSYENLVRFEATYADGTKSIYTIELDAGWIVKKWSCP